MAQQAKAKAGTKAKAKPAVPAEPWDLDADDGVDTYRPTGRDPEDTYTPSAEARRDVGEVEVDTSAFEIDAIQLSDEYVRLPAQVAWANGQVAAAQRDYLTAKAEFEELEARMYMICREELEGEGKKVTEAMIKSRVVADPGYVAARVAKVDAEARLSRLKGEAEAFRAKRDMLIQLGAHVRAEMDSDPVIRQQHAERRRG